ncbi:MAG: preprotein translocase subunit YajC [Actinomycetota bacterium]|nr:preprotein translocase subunit YajC [Actinomycetota bacterium]
MKLKRKLISTVIVSMLIITAVFLSVSCLPVATGEGEVAEGTETGEVSATTNFLTNYGTWIWLAILGVAFYFLLIRPQRVRTKKAKDLMSSLQRGDEVVTIGGFFGRIKDVREDVIIVTIASGVDVKVNRSAISKKVTQQ